MTTSKLRKIAGAAILVVTSCAGHDDEQVTATTTAALEPAPVTPNVPSFFRLESPRGPCPNEAPLSCPGGYWVREVNREDGLRLVSRFDVSALGSAAIEQAAGLGKGEILVRGVFGPADRGALGASFFVVEAWRGLPDVQPRPRDHYVAVESLHGNGLLASWLNGNLEHPFAALSVSSLGPLGVDLGWLSSRVLDHGALVAGRFDGSSTLEASQVFARLPDVVGPCPFYRIQCRDGEVATYNRDDNRCLIPTGCVVPGICPLIVPRCDPGYGLVSWVAQPTGCQAHACDPAFLHQ